MPRSLASWWHLCWIPVAASASLAACATGTVTDTLETGGAGGVGASSSSMSSGGKPQGAQSSATSSSATTGGSAAKDCPEGQFVQNIDGTGTPSCASLDAAARDAVNAGCTIYFGQSDKCSGCSSPPSKWGRVSGENCVNGAGADSTCALATLGEATTMLFGLNLDGDVDDNDKLYLGFTCGEGSSEATPGPCGPTSFVTGVSGTDVTCSPASGSVLRHVHDRCSLYFGHRDNCTGCSLAPLKWGLVGPKACNAGEGLGNTCTNAVLGGVTVGLFGLDLDGDVNEDDKLYLGVHCAPEDAATSMGKEACPDGQIVAGIQADGSLRCVSPAPTIATYFAEHCSFTFGTTDSCNGCTLPPAKWGRVRDGACDTGVGLNDTCTEATLGTDVVQVFGVNTTGNVNEDDKLYIGFHCD